MTQPALTDADFAAAMLQLLPAGDAWPRDAGTVLASLAQGLSDTHAGLYAGMVTLLDAESDPRQTFFLLPDWEAAYGLPDPCTPPNPTITQRRNALLAKILARGGQSPAYFIAVAAALGFAITITTFRTFDLGRAAFGQPMLSAAWRFAWRVNAPTVTVRRFPLGGGGLGEPFWTVDNTELQCRLSAVKPAHTVLWFQYS